MMKDAAKTILVIFLIVVTIASIVVAVFTAKRYSMEEEILKKDYEDRVTELSDSIKSLKDDILGYTVTIDSLWVVRDSLKYEIEKLQQDYEDTNNNIIINGTWDSNMEFLKRYLSGSNN